jgi:hypothetical protein
MVYDRSFKDLNNGMTYKSFFDSIAGKSFSKSDLDVEEIADFLIHGWFYFSGTPVKTIKKEFDHQFHLLDSRNDYDESLSFNDIVELFIAKFELISQKLRSKKLSVDLTGGIDSRLVAVLSRYFDLKFDCVFSLISGSNSELELAKKVSKELGSKLHIIEKNDLQFNIEEHFDYSDGLADIYSLESLMMALEFRSMQDFDLTITGVGGELYKDFWWQQDFPFYGSIKPNLPKLVYSRMYPARYPDDLFQLEELSFNTRINQFINNLRFYVEDKNTATYDRIYHEVRIKEHVSTLSGISAQFVPSYSPLLENELVKLARLIPARKKWFNQFHREIISKLNKPIAQVPITEGGITVSNSFINLTNDAFLYSSVKAKKVLRRFSSSNPKRGLIKDNIDNEFFAQAVNSLKSYNIINPEFTWDQYNLPMKLKTRLISVYLLISNLLND